MSGTPGEDDIEELRKKRLQELQEQQAGEQSEEAEAQQQAADAQKQALLRRYLSDGARQRLNTVRMSKPEFADQVERQIVALAQSGRIQDQLDEDQMKELLRQLTPEKKSFDIRRR